MINRVRWIRGFVMALVLGSGACSAQPEESNDDLSVGSITHGRADGTRDPAVLGLMLGSEGLCTSTLIAPRAVLTARHCVSELSSELVDCSTSGRQIASDRAASSLVVMSGNDVSRGQALARGVRVLTPSSNRICDADIAIVILDRDITGIQPVQVDLDRAPRESDQVVAVGFGQRGENTGAGIRERRGGVDILNVDPSEFEAGQATCPGDSGGPALETGSGAIVGIVSRGTPGCDSPSARNIYTRVDAWSSLIRQGITLGGGDPGASHSAPNGTDPTPGTDDTSMIGSPCLAGNDCPSGYCIRSTQTCTVTCSADDPCPTGYRCGLGSGGVHACFRLHAQ